MRNRNIAFLIGTFLLISLSASSQNVRVIDSLRSLLRAAPRDQQFDLLNAVGFEYRYSYPDSTIHYCNQAFALGTTLNLKKSLSRPLSFIGLAKGNQGDYEEAIHYHNRSLEVAASQHDTIQLAHGYNNVGRIFFDEGDLVRAYTYFLKAKDLFERMHDKSGLAYVYRSLADLFKAKKDYTKALINAEQALALRKELGDSRTITSAYMELGRVYEEMDTTPLALRQFEAADSIATATNDRITKAELKIGMAEILLLERRTEEAAAMADEVLQMVSSTTNQKIYLRARILVAHFLIKTKNYEKASLVLLEVYNSSEKSGNLVFQRDAARFLSELYVLRSRPEEAKEYRDVYLILDGKIQNADLNREIERLQFQLLIEKAETENESLKARRVQDELLIARQRLENIFLGVAALLITIIALLSWRVSRRRKLINQKLEDQNLHILHQREEIAKQNEILASRNHELDEINHQKDTLMNIVAHDLKSPLNRISGLVRIFEKEGNLNQHQLEYVRLMKESTRGGLDLIADLLDVHAWNEQLENLQPSVFSFGEFLREKVAAFGPMAEAKSIRVTLTNDFDQRIISEPNYLGRIVDNLISNAIKFSPLHSIVSVKAGLEGHQIRISVNDQGPGFTKLDQQQLYQKFKKLSARPTADESSNGLGLAIVKTLVDRLHGTIELTSKETGSEFVVRIPVEMFQQSKG